MSHNQNEIGKFGHTPPNSIMKRPCDLLLYDIAGEWANEQGKDQDRYMRIKTAHLDNSELIIFMINLSHLLGLGSSTDPNMQKYSQTITETIKRIKKNKRNKNCHIAFCIVAGDIVETRSVANFDRLAPLRQESIRKNFYKDDTISFNMTEYEAAKVEIMKAFPALFNFRMSSNYGVFFLSAVGSNPIREAVDQNGTSCECFSRFDAKASINWGVTNPIMWYLAKQGIIGQSK